MINQNKVTCDLETFIGSIMLQSELNSCRLSRITTSDNMFQNTESTCSSNKMKYFYEVYSNNVYPNGHHIY